MGVSQPVASVKGEARERVWREGKVSKPNCVTCIGHGSREKFFQEECLFYWLFSLKEALSVY